MSHLWDRVTFGADGPLVGRVGVAVADVIARLAAAGCPVTWDDEIRGTRRFFTADPWGNRIELVGATGD